MVVIDYNDALENGFVQLRQNLIELGEKAFANKQLEVNNGTEE